MKWGGNYKKNIVTAPLQAYFALFNRYIPYGFKGAFNGLFIH